MIDNITMNHQKGEKFSRSKTAKSALCHRFKEHELPFFNKFINLRSDQQRLVCSWYWTSNLQYLPIFIDGLELRHSFPRQNDWTSKCHYKASNLTVNQCLILSVCVFKEFECKVKTFVDSL